MAGLVDPGDLLDHRLELPWLGTVDHVRNIKADHRLVGRNHHHVQAIDLPELVLLGGGGAGHAGQLIEHAEIVLEGDGGEGLGFPLDVDSFLGLDRLVQPLAVAPAEHQPASELVDDDHLAVLDHIVPVSPHQGVGSQTGVDVVGQLQVGLIREVVHPQQLLHLVGAVFCQRHGVQLLVHLVVFLYLHPGYDPGDPPVQIGRFLRLPRNDQRRAGLIDEDAVNLVDDGIVQVPLHHIFRPHHHIVPQVIEAKFVVGAVGDIRCIRQQAVAGLQTVDDQADAQSEEAIDAAHPLAVPAGQVVVHRHDVNPFACQGIQIGRHGGHQGLAFTGFHLGDPALVQHDTAHQLHVEGALAHHAPTGLPDHGEGLRQDIIQGLALRQAFLELLGLGPQLVIGQTPDVWFKLVYVIDRFL